MMRARSAAYAVFLTVVSLLVAPPTPASAATRSPSRSKAAQRAARLNALRASDKELNTAVNTLTGQVNAQIERVRQAKVAASAAQATLDAANAEVAAAASEIDRLHGALVAQAVDIYIRPQGRDTPIDSVDLAAISRKQAILAEVEQRQNDALDALRAAREDLARRRGAASRAQALAAARKHDADTQLNGLARDLNDKQRLSVALQSRIRDAEQEDAAANAVPGDLFGGDFAASKSGLIWPIHGTVTSPFGYRWGRLHAGIDIADPAGTPIHAAKAGKVTFSGWMNGYGNAIIINHGNGMATLYGHQSRRKAKEGDVVKQGDVIGYVGSTGHSTGNHLHFETRINGTPENPRKYLP